MPVLRIMLETKCIMLENTNSSWWCRKLVYKATLYSQLGGQLSILGVPVKCYHKRQLEADIYS